VLARLRRKCLSDLVNVRAVHRGADFWCAPECVRARRTKWSRIESPTGDLRRQILGRSATSAAGVPAQPSATWVVADPHLPFGSWLDAKAASASTAAGLALSRGGGECGGGSTLIRLQGGFLHCEVLVSESPLSTHAGPIAVIAGSLFAVTHVGQFVVTDRSNLVTMMLDPAFRLLSAAYAITFPLMGDCLGGAVLAGGSGGGSVRSGRLLHRGHRHGRLGWRHVV
jgi:hypothetical protein